MHGILMSNQMCVLYNGVEIVNQDHHHCFPLGRVSADVTELTNDVRVVPALFAYGGLGSLPGWRWGRGMSDLD